LARIPEAELESLLVGYGYEPYFVEGEDPARMHQLFAATLDQIFDEIVRIQQRARSKGFQQRPQWPMIVLRTPKGWTCPKVIDGKVVEGTFRSHQVPMSDMDKPEHIKLLERWMKSYVPKELFDENAKLRPDLADLAPKGTRRVLSNERPRPRSVGAGSMDPLKGPEEPRPLVARNAATAGAAITQCAHRGRTSAPGNRPRLLRPASSTRNGRNCAPDAR